MFQVSALCASGRLKVRVITGPSRVTRISSCVGTPHAPCAKVRSPHPSMPPRGVGSVANMGNSLLVLGKTPRRKDCGSRRNAANHQRSHGGVALPSVSVSTLHSSGSTRPSEGEDMKRFAMTVGLGAGLLLLAGHADAQWRYTDDRGVTRVTQYKIDVPSAYRDAAEWIGPVGIGKPGVRAGQVLAAQRWEAIQRIVNAEAGLIQYRNMTPSPPLRDPGGPNKSMATMC